MAHSVLVNTETFELVSASTQPNSAKCLAIIADIEIPSSDYLIIGPTAEWLEKSFTHDELIKIYAVATDDEIERALPITLLRRCVALLNCVSINTQTSVELEKVLGRPFRVKKTPEPEKSLRKKSSKQGGYTRPKMGTATGKVWDIADEMLEANGVIPLKLTVVIACEVAGINPSTAATQYGKWKSNK